MGELTWLQRALRAVGIRLLQGTLAAARCRWRLACDEHHAPCWFCPRPGPPPAPDLRRKEPTDGVVTQGIPDHLPMPEPGPRLRIYDEPARPVVEPTSPFLRLTKPPDEAPSVVVEVLAEASRRDTSCWARPCWVGEDATGYQVAVRGADQAVLTALVAYQPADTFPQRLRDAIIAGEAALRRQSLMLERTRGRS